MSRSPLTDMTYSMMAAKITHAAVELEIPDVLADRPRTCEELAQETRTHAPSLHRLLRALAGVGIVSQTEPDDRGPDRFELTEMGRPLTTDAPGSLRTMIDVRCGQEFWRSWGELVANVRTGETGWELAHGMSWIEYYLRHPQRWSQFNRLMTRYTLEAAPGIIAAYNFARFNTIIDVGGGDGTLLAEVLRAHPGLKGAVFDLPSVVVSARPVLAEAGVAGRCQVLPGDFFASVPAGADAYLMKFILHDWEDEQATAILRNCHSAIPPGGQLLIIEKMLPERANQENGREFVFDIVMMAAIGGKERTENEFRNLLTRADFTVVTISNPLPPLDYRIIEAAPV
jgi:hypothetical protein